jgi:hypothetical protein
MILKRRGAYRNSQGGDIQAVIPCRNRKTGDIQAALLQGNKPEPEEDPRRLVALPGRGHFEDRPDGRAGYEEPRGGEREAGIPVPADKAELRLFPRTEQGGAILPGDPGPSPRVRLSRPAGGPDEEAEGRGAEADPPGRFPALPGFRIRRVFRSRDGKIEGRQGDLAGSVEEKVIFQHGLAPGFPAGAFRKPGFDPYPIQGKQGGQRGKFHLDFPGEGVIHQEAQGPVLPGKGGLGKAFRFQPGRALGFQAGGRQQKPRQGKERCRQKLKFRKGPL